MLNHHQLLKGIIIILFKFVVVKSKFFFFNIFNVIHIHKKIWGAYTDECINYYPIQIYLKFIFYFFYQSFFLEI